jgi:branched-chain amino acid transport system permease protein
MTAVAGALFAYYRGFVSAEAFSLFLTIQYVAMVIIGGMGSVLGAVLGAGFVVLFPYAIEAAMRALGFAERLSSVVFAVNYAAFGLMMILFLVFEPQGLVGLWRRAQEWALLWPFKQKPLAGGR